jgi:hypothetical protein
VCNRVAWNWYLGADQHVPDKPDKAPKKYVIRLSPCNLRNIFPKISHASFHSQQKDLACANLGSGAEATSCIDETELSIPL